MLKKALETFYASLTQDTFFKFFVVLPSVVNVGLAFVGLIEYSATGRVHVWSFMAAIYTIVGIAVVSGLQLYMEENPEFKPLADTIGLFMVFVHDVLAFVVITTTLFALHWVVGTLFVVPFAIVGAFVVAKVAKKLNESEKEGEYD